MGPNRHRGGLTLIELLVVVTLLGFVAATVTVRLSGQLSRAALGQAVTEWESADQQLRSRACRKGQPAELKFEIGSNQLQLLFDPESESKPIVRSFSRGVRLAKFRSAMREITSGPVTMDYTEQGTSETYVVELAGRAGSRWVLVAGLTGQATELTDEHEAETLLDRLLPASVHAP